jgi:intraflagellar transport protein 56
MISRPCRESLIALFTMAITSKFNKLIYNYNNRKALDLYEELTKRPEYDKNIHAYKACCQYALCNYKEAKQEASKAEESGLKNRLLFQLAQKVGDENEIMNYHSALTNSVED